MTARGRALAIFILGALYAGLSFGARICYIAAIFSALALFYSILTVFIVRRSIISELTLSSQQTPRGEAVSLSVHLTCRCLLPVSPLRVFVQTDERLIEYPVTLEKQAAILNANLPARHVGMPAVGVRLILFTDILGLIRGKANTAETLLPLTVLPRSFATDPLRFLSESEGGMQQNRAVEDLSSPEDIRVYRQGDPLKRVHWKLSARKRELLVRKFETPAPPDTLILMNPTSVQFSSSTESSAASLRDALCETALSIAEMQLKSGDPVILPLYGEVNDEFSSTSAADTIHLAEQLALISFNSTADFSDLLALELRRMRRTGATAVITAQLTAEIVEAVCQMRRAGPSVRLCLVTMSPDAPQDRPYVARLQQHSVEVCYVQPA